MAISWRIKRQFLFFSIFAFIFVLLVLGLIYLLRPAPTCFDQKQNQREEGVDCGGPCEACVGQASDLVIFWTRALEVASGFYEVASFIENPNLLLGARELVYRVRLYDTNNILVALREGRTFVNPREKFLIFEESIETRERIPVRATIEFNPIRWRRIEKERPQLVVASKEFENVPNGRLGVLVRNQSLFPVEDIYLSSALVDENGNALGASTSFLERIEGESSREVFFTWPRTFFPPPASIEVLVRTNLTE
jgi:hypothetical protein